MKKGSANMWWIIIGAVIALVVMIILMVIFTSKTAKLEGGLSGCDSKGGICVPGMTTGTDPCPANTLRTTAFDCNDNKVCCIGAPKSCTVDSECGANKCAGFGDSRYCAKN